MLCCVVFTIVVVVVTVIIVVLIGIIIGDKRRLTALHKASVKTLCVGIACHKPNVLVVVVCIVEGVGSTIIIIRVQLAIVVLAVIVVIAVVGGA